MGFLIILAITACFNGIRPSTVLIAFIIYLIIFAIMNHKK